MSSVAAERTVELPSGILRLELTRQDWALDDLCGFAVRANPKRGFLFVSKVLGKHLSVPPSTMKRTYEALAEKVTASNLPGPVLFIALAETATGLGQGVFEASLERGLNDALFIHTTRAHLEDASVALNFQEPHSHATGHLIYRPDDAQSQRIFAEAKSLVLIDDEISTGTTLTNLAQSYAQLNANVEHIALVSLTDWLSEPSEVERKMPAPLTRINLSQGRYTFDPNPSFRPPDLSYESRGQTVGVSRDYGRFGKRTALKIDIEGVLESLNLSPDESVLVLGTGEHLHLPFRLALDIERRGYNVHFQSTTRSPILEGESIRSILRFMDPVDGTTPNYLYNVVRGQYGAVLILYDTPHVHPDHDLPAQLGAVPILPTFLETSCAS